MISGNDVTYEHEAVEKLTRRGCVPVPDSSITCGLVEALSMIESVPCCKPFCVGENVALIVHFAPAARVAPHVDVMPNSELAFMEAIFRAVAPVLVRLTVCGALVVPTRCFLKFSGVVGEKLTTPVLSSMVI